MFSSSEQFSCNLQAKNMTVQEATHGADLLISRMKSLRTEAKFNDEIEQESRCLTEEPIIPHYQKMPKRYDEGSNPHQYQSPKDCYRHAYFEVLEVIAGEIEHRFDHPDLEIIKDIENLVISFSNGATFDISDRVSRYFENDIHCTRLKHQLSMLPNMIRTA